MKQCKYTQSLLQINLSQQVKNEILQTVYDAKTQQESVSHRQPSKAKTKKRKLWISITSACSLVVFVGLFLVLAFGVQVFHFYIVNNPIDSQMRTYMADTVNNAQYLPNIYLLSNKSSQSGSVIATEGEDNSDGSENASSGGSSDSAKNTNDEDELDFVSQQVGDELVLTLEDYQAINDINYNGIYIEDIKEEIKVVIDIIPGYDQWFRMPNELPYMDESEQGKYIFNIYKVSVDQENNHISLTKISGAYRGQDFYDKENKEFIVEKYYSREVTQIEYYIDEQGREVVECIFNNYVMKGDFFYPIHTQIIKNVKDTQTTSLSITYARENELIEPYEYTYHGFDDTLSSCYEVQNNHKYGVNLSFTQLNYTNSNDISMVTLNKILPDNYTGNPQSTILSAYRKDGDNVGVYSNIWGYFDDEESAVEGFLVQPSYVYNFLADYRDYLKYSDEIDYREFVFEAMTMQISSRNPANYVCEFCEKYDYTFSDVFIYCPHIKSCDEIYDNQQILLYNNQDVFGNLQSMYQVVQNQLQKMYENVVAKSVPMTIDTDKGEYAFEYAVDEYSEALVKDYIDNVFDINQVYKLQKDGDLHYAKISYERINEVMQDKHLYISTIDSDTYYTDGKLKYDVDITISNGDYDPDKEYYLIIYMHPISTQRDILIEQKLDLQNQNTYSFEGEWTLEEILNTCHWDTDKGGYKYLSVVLISYDQEGEIVYEVPRRELPLSEINLFLPAIEGEYTQGIKTMKYKIHLSRRLYLSYQVTFTGWSYNS